VAHLVELLLTLEVVRMAKRRHGGDCCGYKGKDRMEAGRQKALGKKSKSQKCERRRKGTTASGEDKCEKVANPYGVCL
jgi:hypothetical protein